MMGAGRVTPRNIAIFRSVLRGYTYKETGQAFGLTGTRCRQICFGLNRKLLKLQGGGVKDATLKSMRTNKNRLISEIENVWFELFELVID